MRQEVSTEYMSIQRKLIFQMFNIQNILICILFLKRKLYFTIFETLSEMEYCRSPIYFPKKIGHLLDKKSCTKNHTGCGLNSHRAENIFEFLFQTIRVNLGGKGLCINGKRFCQNLSTCSNNFL